MDKKTDKTTVLKIKRSVKDPKSKIVSLRLTAQEKESMNRMKQELKFNSVRDLFLFCLHAIKKIYGWHLEGYTFFIKKDGEEGNYQALGFEFKLDLDDDKS